MGPNWYERLNERPSSFDVDAVAGHLFADMQFAPSLLAVQRAKQALQAAYDCGSVDGYKKCERYMLSPLEAFDALFGGTTEVERRVAESYHPDARWRQFIAGLDGKKVEVTSVQTAAARPPAPPAVMPTPAGRTEMQTSKPCHHVCGDGDGFHSSACPAQANNRPAGTTEMTTARPCTCTTATLMTAGCKCGGK